MQFAYFGALGLLKTAPACIFIIFDMAKHDFQHILHFWWYFIEGHEEDLSDGLNGEISETSVDSVAHNIRKHREKQR